MILKFTKSAQMMVSRMDEIKIYRRKYQREHNALVKALLIAKLRLIRLEGLLPGETTKEIQVIDKVIKTHKN